MSRKYQINPLTGAGIDEAIRGVEEYRNWIIRKTKELAERCAELGADSARIVFQGSNYIGDKDVDVRVEPHGDNGFLVVARGTATWFIEFGSGLRFGKSDYGTQYGMGAGTYPIPPGKGHWDDPKGWYLPKEKGGYHTYGNPPAMAMYNGRKEIELEFERIVREVFSGD